MWNRLEESRENWNIAEESIREWKRGGHWIERKNKENEELWQT